MVYKIRQVMRGFTLIELLVVIAIIGLLASIVLVSLSTARQRARDSRRLGDLRQTQLALELSFDATGGYPVGTIAAGALLTQAQTVTEFTGTLATALAPTYMPAVPVDPTNSGVYRYGYVSGTTGTVVNCVAGGTCLHYLLVVGLEDQANAGLDNDNDGATGGFSANNGFNCAPAGGIDPYCIYN